MKRVANALITIGMMIVLLLVVLMCSACHKDDDDGGGMGPIPSPVPTVECCDFRDRHDCREVRAHLLEKPGFVAKLGVCFDHKGRCFTGCPEGGR